MEWQEERTTITPADMPILQSSLHFANATTVDQSTGETGAGTAETATAVTATQMQHRVQI